MKKAIVLLLALGMVAVAFAQTPVVSGSSTLTWGFDLDTSNHGFLNTNSVKVTVPFTVPDTKKTGENVYGEISLSAIKFKLIDPTPTTDKTTTGMEFMNVDNTTDMNSATFAAKIVAGALTVTVSSDMTMDFLAADPIDNYLTSAVTDVGSSIDADTYGTKLTYALGDLGSVSFGVSSKADWTLAATSESEYAVAASAAIKAVPDLLTVNVGASYDLLDDTTDLVAFASFPVTVAALTLTPAVDVQIDEGADLLFDASVDVGYDLTETAAVSAYAYYRDADNLEFEVTFDEDSGFVPGLAFGFGADYFTKGSNYAANVYGSYKSMLGEVNYVKPYFDVTLDKAENLDIEAGVEAMLFPNTTLTAKYVQASTATVDDKGVVTFAAKVSF